MAPKQYTDAERDELLAKLEPLAGLAEHVGTLKRDAELAESLSVVRKHYKAAFLTIVGIIAAIATMGNHIVDGVKWLFR